jgi:hypothetical protein
MKIARRISYGFIDAVIALVVTENNSLFQSLSGFQAEGLLEHLRRREKSS